MFYNYYKSGDKDIFFITNFNRQCSYQVNLSFTDAVRGKQAWLWDAETGKDIFLIRTEPLWRYGLVRLNLSSSSLTS